MYHRLFTTFKLKLVFILHAIIKAKIHAFLFVLNCICLIIKIYIKKSSGIVVSLDPELSAIVGQFCRNL